VTEQEIANLVLMAMLLLLPIALGVMLSGRSRGNRYVLKWARGLAVATIVLAVAYDLAGAVFLLRAEPRDGSWMTPPAAADDPSFYLPIGVGAFVAGLGILIGVTRARHRLGPG
jgi:hypothetical protein